MLSAKQKTVVHYDLYWIGRAFLIAMGWGTAIELFFILISAIFDGISVNGLIAEGQGLVNIWSTIVMVMPAFYFLIMPYSNFKWTIQNGITRKTLWQSQMLSAVLIACIQLVLLLIFDLITHNGMNFYWLVVDSGLASKSAPLWQGILVNFCLLFETLMSWMAAGYFFGLLSRKWKIIVAIGGPIALMIVMYYAILGLVKIHFFEALFGNWNFVLSGQEAKLAIIVTFIVTQLIWTLIMILISWLCAKRMQLRRD